MPATAETTIRIEPNPGPQHNAFACSADILIYGGAAGGGKLLPLDTPLPTPSGWTTMGEIRKGDELYDETGHQCVVTHVFDIKSEPELWRLTFDDGSTIDACSDHQWVTFNAKELGALTRRTDESRSRRQAKRPSRKGKKKSKLFSEVISKRNQTHRPATKAPPTGTIRTTREIAATLLNYRGRRNHAIEVAEPLLTVAAELPIAPYLLGVWLGDGTRTTGQVTSADPEIFESFTRLGYELGKPASKPNSKAVSKTVLGLRGQLAALCVLDNKHIPSVYTRASKEQRLALLQGLMDTDGTVARHSGAAEFTTTCPRLAEGIAELIVSLGWKARVREGRAKLSGKDHGPKWTLKWNASDYVFRLDRKRDLQTLATRRTCRFRYIVNAERIASRPGRCISVDSDRRLYLAGKQMVPTHNSFYLLAEPTRHCMKPGFRGTIFRRTFQQVTQAGGLWDESQLLYRPLGGKSREGNDLDWRFPSGARIKFAHLQHEKDKHAYQGGQLAYAGFDELTHFTESQFWYIVSRMRSMVVNPYIRATCNPEPGWVADLISWWINDDGFAIPERSGVVRYLLRSDESEDNEIVWGDSKEELIERFPGTEPDDIMSFSFIAASLDDNPKMLEKDPRYRAKLKALPRIERERLLLGNWRIQEGALISPEWVNTYVINDGHYECLVGGSLVKVPISACRRFATIDTAGTSKEKAAEQRGDPPSHSALGVWDYHPQTDLLFANFIWRDQVDWSGLKERVPSVLKTRKVPRSYIENAHFGQPLKKEIKGRATELIGPKIPGMDDGSRGAKLERAIASGMLSRFEDGLILLPEVDMKNRNWVNAYRRELLAWTGLPKETSDQIDITSYASYVAKTRTGSWGGVVPTGGMARR